MYTTQLEQLKQNQMERANNYQSKRDNLNKPRFALVKGKIIDRMQSFNSSITALSLIKVANSLDSLLARRNNQIKELQAENEKLQAELEALREAHVATVDYMGNELQKSGEALLESFTAIDYKIYKGKKIISCYEIDINKTRSIHLKRSRLKSGWFICEVFGDTMGSRYFNGDSWTSKTYYFDSAVDGVQAWVQGGK